MPQTSAERDWVIQITKVRGEQFVRWQIRGAGRSSQGRSASRAAAVREVNALIREFGIDRDGSRLGLTPQLLDLPDRPVP